MKEKLIELNNEIKEKSFFGKMFDSLKNMSQNAKLNVSLSLCSAAMIATLSPIASNLYLNHTLSNGVYDSNKTKVEQFQQLGNNYVEALNNDGLFNMANKVATIVNKVVFQQEQTNTNADIYFEQIKTATGAYHNIDALKGQKLKLIQAEDQFMKDNKITFGTDKWGVVAKQFKAEGDKLQKEIDVLKDVDSKIENTKLSLDLDKGIKDLS